MVRQRLMLVAGCLVMMAWASTDQGAAQRPHEKPPTLLVAQWVHG
jgi:hypothetical protein